MRITAILRAQHIGNMFKRHWKVQGRRIPHKTGAFKYLEENGIPVVDVLDVVYPKRPPVPEYIEDHFFVPGAPLDENHPLYNAEKCHLFGDSNVLVDGVKQAQVLTKSLVVRDLPAKVKEIAASTECSPGTDLYMKNAILSAHLFDAYQNKLPIRKDLSRPAWNFPRDYGIPADRKFNLIIEKILLECERLAGLQVSSQKKIVDNVRCVLPFIKDDLKYQFDITAEKFITSKSPIEVVEEDHPSLEAQRLPSLGPINVNVSIASSHFYNLEDIYPIYNKSPYAHPHTILFHYTPENTKNYSERPITESQKECRNMLKAFTVAAARARSLYGPDIKDLPEPITIQTVQVYYNEFQFGVFQLNTLDLDGTEGQTNTWYCKDTIKLYDECTYLLSRPRLNAYNPEVLKMIYAFYSN